MNWKKFWSNPYRWGLWHWIGGRPWTYIMRDFAYQNPFLVLMLGFSLGMTLHSYVEWRDLIIGFSFFLLAHLFWGTKYKRGQRGN